MQQAISTSAPKGVGKKGGRLFGRGKQIANQTKKYLPWKKQWGALRFGKKAGGGGKTQVLQNQGGSGKTY